MLRDTPPHTSLPFSFPSSRRTCVGGEQPQRPPAFVGAGRGAALWGGVCASPELEGGAPPYRPPPPPPTYPQGREPGWPRAGFLRSAVGKTLLRAAPRSRAVPRSGGRPRRRPPLPCPRGWGGWGGGDTHDTRGGAVGGCWQGCEACHPWRSCGHVEAESGGSPLCCDPVCWRSAALPQPPTGLLGLGRVGLGFWFVCCLWGFFFFFFPFLPSFFLPAVRIGSKKFQIISY